MDIPTCLASGVCLIEWPERLGAEMTPASRVDVHVRAIRGTGRRDREGSGQVRLLSGRVPNDQAAGVGCCEGRVLLCRAWVVC